MMEDSINRKVAIESCMNHYEVGNKEQNSVIDWCVDMLTDLPSAERYARWEYTDYGGVGNYHCTACRAIGNENFKFCPYCGAKMVRGNQNG